ncbi:ABC transporter permease [Streptomyces malaysiensis]|uniref:ABC transporter permease n=1 Tax=Streptomyces malaysiensis TaxID=92644 RepID=A0A7X6AUC4_STRMQ|nr:ABC transporter permease [Streptomyces malaysiensis]NIY62495.1 ABC transporter permease [Streptomyces malaysiensis]
MPEQPLLTKNGEPPAGPSGATGSETDRAAAPRPTGSPAARRIGRALGPWAVPLLALAVWQVTARTGVLAPSVLPGPQAVLRAGTDLAATGDLQQYILTSLRRIAQGFALGAATGLVLGFVVGMSKLAELLLDRSLQMVRTIPHLALVPLMIAWFGIGEEPKILLVALGTFFPIYLNTVTGIRGVDPKLLELGRSYGLGRWSLVRDIAVPGAMPTILAGIRYSLGVAWITLVVAETISADDGIGYLAQDARQMLRTDQMVLAIVLYALAGLLADLLTRLVERRVLRWHPHYRRPTS